MPFRTIESLLLVGLVALATILFGTFVGGEVSRLLSGVTQTLTATR